MSGIEYEVSSRGFKHMAPIPSTYPGELHVYESSSAAGPHVWIAVKGQDGAEGHAHLTLESVRQLRDQLEWLIANHYQVGGLLSEPTKETR
jgi:hypothetical protein